MNTGDVQDMANSNIKNTSIEVDVSWKAKEFERDFGGREDDLQLSDIDFRPSKGH